MLYLDAKIMQHSIKLFWNLTLRLSNSSLGMCKFEIETTFTNNFIIYSFK